jgi:hypothetical protein
MYTQTSVAGLLVALAAVLAAGCRESLDPTRYNPRPTVGPSLATTTSGSTSITLDREEIALNTGTAWGVGETHVGKAFDVNPHLGDAIVATFVWQGSTNTINTVTDHLEDGTPVGNTYTLVEYVTAGGYSMATYVATNVQNFPDPAPSSAKLLAVHAIFSNWITEGGIMISAYTGVDPAAAQALGAHQSASGAGSGSTIADPGSLTVGAGALAYGVTMANAVVGLTEPMGFTEITWASDPAIKVVGDYAVLNGGSVDPQWTWSFNAPSTWFASVLALNPATTHLAFTVQPSTTLPATIIRPPVQVTAVDGLGNPVPTFTGPVTISIGHNGGLLLPGTLSGTTTVTAVNGVATFSDLSIDQPGNGYTLLVAASGATAALSTPFNIGVL